MKKLWKFVGILDIKNSELSTYNKAASCLLYDI